MEAVGQLSREVSLIQGVALRWSTSGDVRFDHQNLRPYPATGKHASKLNGTEPALQHFACRNSRQPWTEEPEEAKGQV
jgi:hypothetical protein